MNTRIPLPPPDGYESWLDYAVETIDTRSVQLLTMFDDDKQQVAREAMRAEARKALLELKQAAGTNGPSTNRTPIVDPLESFDPTRHGCEVMAVAAVGREIGSPDYELLCVLDMHICGTITESRAMELLDLDRTALLIMMNRDGLIRTSTEYDVALKVVSELVDADPERGTPDGDRLEVWGALVQRYEAQHFTFD